MLIAACGKEPTARQDTLDRRLLAAAYGNDVAEPRRLIAAGADVDTKDGSEQSAYLIATSEVGDDPRLLELTLKAGAAVDAKDSYNGTGRIRAAERGYDRVVRRLLETDINVDHVNRLGWTALLEATMLGEDGRAHTDTVRLLEYTALIDNNVYTNLMAAQNLRAAADLARAHPERAAALKLGQEEIAGWRDAADAVIVPFDEDLGVTA